MQGYKSYEEKLFYTFRLSERVPVNNFYRRLKGVWTCPLSANILRSTMEKRARPALIRLFFSS